MRNIFVTVTLQKWLAVARLLCYHAKNATRHDYSLL